MDAKEMTFKVIDFAEAQEVADWTGIILDLEFVKAACSRLLIESEISRDPVLSRALIVSAIITYARCFNQGGGVRLALHDNDLEAMGVDMSLHGYIMELRSKHIAHSVSSFEQAVVGVADVGGRLEVVDLTQHMIGVPAKSIAELKEMAEFLIKVVVKYADNANANVIAKYQSLTSDQVLALRPIQLQTPKPNEVGEAREGLKRRRRRGRG